MNLLGLRSVRRNNAMSSQGTKDKTLPPRLPSEARANVSMAGLRTLQVPTYLPDFPDPSVQCHLGLSYLLTAAGQLRILTGFPFHSPRGETLEYGHYILRRVYSTSLGLVDMLPTGGWVKLDSPVSTTEANQAPYRATQGGPRTFPRRRPGRWWLVCLHLCAGWVCGCG